MLLISFDNSAKSYVHISQVWFQNRRAKAKRERHGSSSECCSNDTEAELTEEEQPCNTEQPVTDTEDSKETQELDVEEL